MSLTDPREPVGDVHVPLYYKLDSRAFGYSNSLPKPTPRIKMGQQAAVSHSVFSGRLDWVLPNSAENLPFSGIATAQLQPCHTPGILAEYPTNILIDMLNSTATNFRLRITRPDGTPIPSSTLVIFYYFIVGW